MKQLVLCLSLTLCGNAQAAANVDCQNEVSRFSDAETKREFENWVRAFGAERVTLEKAEVLQKEQLKKIFEKAQKPGSLWKQMKSRSVNDTRDLDGQFQTWLDNELAGMNRSFSKKRESLTYRTYYALAHGAVWHDPLLGAKPAAEPKEAWNKHSIYDSGILTGPSQRKQIWVSTYKGEGTVSTDTTSTTDKVFPEESVYRPRTETTINLDTGKITDSASLFSGPIFGDEKKLEYVQYLYLVKRAKFTEACEAEINDLVVNPLSGKKNGSSTSGKPTEN